MSFESNFLVRDRRPQALGCWGPLRKFLVPTDLFGVALDVECLNQKLWPEVLQPARRCPPHKRRSLGALLVLLPNFRLHHIVFELAETPLHSNSVDLEIFKSSTTALAPLLLQDLRLVGGESRAEKRKSPESELGFEFTAAASCIENYAAVKLG